MSGTWPTSPGYKSDELISDQPILETTSGSGISQRRIIAGHLWRLRLSYPTMLREQIAPIFGFEMKQRGESFQISLPEKNEPQGNVTGSINNNGVCEVGAEVINIEGFVAGTADVFKVGDIFKADNHSKVYMVNEDASAGANSDLLLEDGSSFLLLEDGTSHLLLESSEQASVSFSPPMREEITDGVNITYNNVQFTVSIDSDGIQKWKTSAPRLSTYSVELKEAL